MTGAAARAVACRRLSWPAAEVETGAAPWQRWAGEMLGPAERATWDGMQALPKRRSEWLLGRIVAKEAVVQLLRASGYRTATPRAVEIVSDPLGRPEVRCEAAPTGTDSVVTIAHTRGVAVALAGLGRDLLLGIDIEPMLGKYPRFQYLAFTPEERQLVAGLDEGRRSEWYLRLWCAKEATGKALGRGLLDGLHAIRVEAAGFDTGEVRLVFRERCFSACTSRVGDYVVATVVHAARFSF
jgi:phosphopantetheinyl transferase